VLTILQEEGKISQSPARKLGGLIKKIDSRTSKEVTQVDSWSREEVHQLLETARAQESEFYPMLFFLLTT
jgi:hypothetical protein